MIAFKVSKFCQLVEYLVKNESWQVRLSGGGRSGSQTSAYENKISKSSVFLANALKQKQKSSSQPTHIAPKINCCPENRWYAIWGFCSPQQPQQQNLSPKFSGKVNNQFCLWLSTQNKTWLEGRKEVVILQEMVKSSGIVLFWGGVSNFLENHLKF